MTLVAGNVATSIHDFELALIGETSENVPAALDKGQFGMAYEFGYINMALSVGNQQKLGFGEVLGRMICEERFRRQVLALVAKQRTRLAVRAPGGQRACRLLSAGASRSPSTPASGPT